MKDNLTSIAPQARYHSNRLDQIDRLIHAAESDEDIAYLARLLTLCSLPRTNPGNRKEYVRTQRPLHACAHRGLRQQTSLRLHRTAAAGLGVYRSGPDPEPANSSSGSRSSEFMRVVGIDPAGASYARVRDQMRRLFACSITLVCKDSIGCSRISSYVADRHAFWWNHVQPGDRGQWRSEIRLGEGVFTEIIRHPVPLDMNVLKALNQSSLGLDLYLWLNYRTFGLHRPLRISWKRLYEQFALNPARAATDKNAVNDFRSQSHPGADQDQDRVARPGLCPPLEEPWNCCRPPSRRSPHSRRPTGLLPAGRSRSGDPPDSAFCTTAAVHTTCS